MKLLLDTHVLLWAVGFPKLLSPATRSLLNNPRNELLFSVASIWEVAIKHSRGRMDFQVPPTLLRRTLMDDGYEELPVLGQHAVAVDSLPPIHKDPFDRLLIVQAMVEGIILLTVDETVARYPGPIRKI